MPRQADVTVLLPAYNAAPYVAEAVESILRQTYPHFTLLAMDDGSTDGTGDILDRLAAGDGRMRVVHRENRGLVPTLNEGMTLCETELVARMDADDWAMPERLFLQKEYMDAHPEIVVCGSAIEVYETGRYFPVTTGAPFDVSMLFRAPFAHPTVMYRRDAVLSVGGYDASMIAAEDYDLWTRMSAAGYGMHNLPQALLRWRRHPGASRVTYRRAMRQSRDCIWARQLRLLGIEPGPAELDMHAYCAEPCDDIAWQQRRARAWLQHICEMNRLHGSHDQTALEQECRRIAAAFPPPLSPWTHPLRCAARTARHLFMALCRRSGPLGIRLESAARSCMQRLRAAWGRLQ